MGRWPDRDRLRRVLVLLLPGAAAVYLAFRSGNAAAGAFATLAVACLGALVVRAAPGTFDSTVMSRAATAAVLALPGGLTVYFAFNAGGFFPETPAFVAIVLILVLVVRVTTAEHPFAGFSWPLAVAAIGLGLYCLWALLSATWSDAPSRALIEFDRAFLYLVALVLFGSLPRSSDALRWMLRGLALGIVVVAVAAFVSRALPEVFPTEPGLSKRLGWPLTYWNALGILGSLGAVLCLHLTSSLREHVAVRVAAAATVPVIAATVLLTFSRGAILAGILGLLAYAVVGRPRGLATGLLAAVPLGALAVKFAYDATLLSGDHQRSAAAIDEGHDLALLVAACCVGAALLRAALAVAADWRLAALSLDWSMTGRAKVGAWAGSLALVVVALIALDVPDRVQTQYDRFVDTPKVSAAGETRERLTDPANTGRIDHWNVAFDAFQEDDLRGNGAGTYGPLWMRERPADNTLVVDDAHSLYVETLSELGIIGLALIFITVVLLLAAFAPVRRGADRAVYGALFAAGLAWAIHAGIDWDWEMPGVTAWLFCLGGAALASARARTPPRPGPLNGTRVVVGAVLLAGAIAPALVFVSQRQIDDAADAYERGDCKEAAERAVAAVRTLENRPDPYEVLALCDVHLGFDRLGVAALERAVERDPDNWEFLYTLAAVRGSAGLDPRPAAREALRNNPHDSLTRALARYADTPSRQQWIARLRPIAENERLSVVR